MANLMLGSVLSRTRAYRSGAEATGPGVGAVRSVCSVALSSIQKASQPEYPAITSSSSPLQDQLSL